MKNAENVRSINARKTGQWEASPEQDYDEFDHLLDIHKQILVIQKQISALSVDFEKALASYVNAETKKAQELAAIDKSKKDRFCSNLAMIGVPVPSDSLQPLTQVVAPSLTTQEVANDPASSLKENESALAGTTQVQEQKTEQEVQELAVQAQEPEQEPAVIENNVEPNSKDDSSDDALREEFKQRIRPFLNKCLSALNALTLDVEKQKEKIDVKGDQLKEILKNDPSLIGADLQVQWSSIDNDIAAQKKKVDDDIVKQKNQASQNCLAELRKLGLMDEDILDEKSSFDIEKMASKMLENHKAKDISEKGKKRTETNEPKKHRKKHEFVGLVNPSNPNEVYRTGPYQQWMFDDAHKKGFDSSSNEQMKNYVDEEKKKAKENKK